MTGQSTRTEVYCQVLCPIDQKSVLHGLVAGQLNELSLWCWCLDLLLWFMVEPEPGIVSAIV